MLNKIFLQGRLTRDPELRYTNSQIPVTSFSLAVDRDYSGRDGGEKQTDFFDCVAWRSTAEFVQKYFAKGRAAVVVGSVQFRDWTDRNGNKRRSTEVVVESIYFADSKKDGDGQRQQSDYSAPADYRSTDRYASAPSSAGRPVDVQADFDDYDEDDGDLPF